jgi:hypothetical protein
MHIVNTANRRKESFSGLLGEPDGTPEAVVRTVTANSRALKFASSGFEEA